MLLPDSCFPCWMWPSGSEPQPAFLLPHLSESLLGLGLAPWRLSRSSLARLPSLPRSSAGSVGTAFGSTFAFGIATVSLVTVIYCCTVSSWFCPFSPGGLFGRPWPFLFAFLVLSFGLFTFRLSFALLSLAFVSLAIPIPFRPTVPVACFPVPTVPAVVCL